MTMKASLVFHRLRVLLAGVAVVAAGAGCGAAAPDASKAYSRSVIQSGGVVQEENLRVAEYLNYYEQKFPEPVNGAVGLDVRTGNWQVPVGEAEVWVQIGMQAKSAQPEEIAPLNLALVIDCSGSMDTADKMPYVRQSLRLFLGSLAANDRVAIVRYADGAQVITRSREVGDGEWIERAIERLAPDGSTNLHAGLMAGLDEVSRHYDPARSNAVILLTDGIANVGEVDPQAIAQDARAYTERGIHLSTIGLGSDFNDALLTELAKQGQGGYHFIDSGQEMDKVFRRDVLGLLAKVATDVSLTLTPAEGVQLLEVTGQQGALPAGPITVPMRDMGYGDSQVLLAHLTIDSRRMGDDRPLMPLTVELRYTGVPGQELTVLNAAAKVVDFPLDAYEPLRDTEVTRNVTIQRSAEGLKEIARLYNERRYGEAYALAARLEHDLRTVAARTGEAQMIEDADMMRQYQETLRQHLPGGWEDRGGSGNTGGRFVRGTPTPVIVEVE
jgi:Ca-activated chloride channel family protein